MKKIWMKLGFTSIAVLTLAGCASNPSDRGESTSEAAATSSAVSSQAPAVVEGGTKAANRAANIEFSEADLAALTAEEIAGQADRLDVIKERGTIRFGYSGSFAPYNFKNPATGEYTGFETEIAQLVAADLGVTAEFVEMSFQSLIPATDLDPAHPESIDVALNNHGRTPERAAEHDFSLPYLESVFGVWVKSDSELETLADLDGLKAAQSPTGSTADAAEAVGASELVPVTTATDGLKMVEQGRADFHVMDYNATLWRLKNEPAAQLRVLEETIERPDPVGMAIAQGSPQLLNALNKSIAKHTENGDYGKIYTKYLGEDITVAPETFTAFTEQTGIKW